MQQSSVREVMGEYAISFVKVDAANKKFKWMNDRGDMKRMYKTWVPFLPELQSGVQYYSLVTKTLPAKSKSGSTFQIIGILSWYDNYEDAEEVSKFYRVRHKFLETDEQKLKWTKNFGRILQDWHEHNEDFNAKTLSKLLEVA